MGGCYVWVFVWEGGCARVGVRVRMYVSVGVRMCV